ncbi:hypothetical protein S40293_07765 [Stachybotrys chartarum IBT 40293]|nr:hypothetical protein S40293_07765 [Stachybotrys chartarum IBT 40293]
MASLEKDERSSTPVVCVTPVADADPFTEKSTVEDDAAPAAERGDASSPRKRTVFAVDRLPMTIWVVAVAGAAERFAYYSLSAPMPDAEGPGETENYVQNQRSGFANPGALGLGQQTATNLTNVFMLLQFIAPLPWALLADMRLGRLKTLMISMCVYQAGTVVLLVTSLPFALERGAGLPGFLVALLLIAVGVAGLKATLPPFLVDQYTRTESRSLKETDDEVVVSDRTLTIQFITNVFFWMTNIAALSSLASTWIEREVDFWASYLMASLCLLLTQILIFAGRNKFTTIQVQGNIVPLATKAMWCAVRNGWSLRKASPDYQRQHHGREVPWSDATLKDIRGALAVSRILVFSCPFYLGYLQVFHNMISQAGQMRLGGMSNDTMQVFNPVACIVLGPVIQRGLFPLLRRMGVPFGPMARIATACFIMGAAMAYAAVLQHLIYSAGPCYTHPLHCPAAVQASSGLAVGNDVSVWMQMPVWFILAVGEIFGFATISEIAYEMAPKSMKSLVQAVTQLTAGLAAVVGIALSPLTRDPTLVILYGVIGGLTAVAAVLFWLFFKDVDTAQNQEHSDGEDMLQPSSESER